MGIAPLFQAAREKRASFRRLCHSSGPGKVATALALTAVATVCYVDRGRGECVAVQDLKSLIRTIPDYPKKGILFRDVTTLLGDARGFKAAITAMAAPFAAARPNAVAGIEARGFILGGAVADRLGCGFVPLRKKGKLPAKTIGQEYTLEYGVDIIEMHEGAIRRGERVLIVDDLIATGGTAEAAVKLVRRSGGEIVGATFIIELPELGGAGKLSALGVAWHALMAFAGH
jgi:adenine phosphoribosyltransferase